MVTKRPAEVTRIASARKTETAKFDKRVQPISTARFALIAVARTENGRSTSQGRVECGPLRINQISS